MLNRCLVTQKAQGISFGPMSFATIPPPPPHQRALALTPLILYGELAPLPHLLPVDKQIPEANRPKHTQTSQQAATLGDTHVQVQRPPEQNSGCGKGAPQSVIRSKKARGILRVAEWQVDEDAETDDEAAAAVHDDAERGHDPVYGAASRPAEEEHACRDAEDAHKAGAQERLLGIEGAELFETLLDEEAVPGAVPGRADDAGYEDADEDCA